MTTNRRLAAILAADVAGYSRLMAADEVGTLAALKAVRREVVDPAIAEHNGRIVKTTGDGMLVEFASAVDAVTCAMAVQEKMAARGGEITFRIGINVGDIIIDGDDIFGDGVNVAARVENECQPGRVYLSAQAFDQVRAKTPFSFEDLGERRLKNIDRSIRLYAASGVVALSGKVEVPEPGKPPPLPDKPSIAVLPFQNMSGDPEQDYFADGMVEDIIMALSRFKSLFVIARNSSFTYKGKQVDIKQVGRELGVHYALEGSVRKIGGQVRITGQLIETYAGTHLWADKFDGALDNIFQLQDAVVEQVVGQIAPSIEQAEVARSRRKPVEHLEAYDFYLKGREQFSLGGRERVEQALTNFYRAVEIDPAMACGYAAIASCYNSQVTNGWMLNRERVLRETERCVVLAAKFGQDDAECLALCALGHGFVLRHYGIADTLVDRAIALNPNSSTAWRIRALANIWFGRHDQIIEAADRAIRLNPRDRWTISRATGAKGFALFHQGRPEKACELAAHAYELAPEWNLMLFLLAISKVRSDETPPSDAHSLMQQYLAHHPHLRVKNLADHFPAVPEDLRRLTDAARLAGLPE